MKSKTLIDHLARITSTIFVPPTLAVFTFTYFSLIFEKDTLTKTFSIIISTILLFVIPIILFFVLRRRNKITDNDTTIKEQRIFPYFIGAILNLIGLIISFVIHLDQNIIFLWLVYLVNTAIILFITKLWKISAHSLGIAIPFAVFSFYLHFNLALILFLILILVGWSRLHLKIHSRSQVILGAFAGIITVFFFLTLLTGRY